MTQKQQTPAKDGQIKTVFKLTSRDNETYGGFKWTPGKWEGPLRGGGHLCAGGYFHFYESPLLAVLLNPLHANIRDYRLWEAEVRGETLAEWDKCGAVEMRITVEVRPPKITLVNSVAFGLLSALEVNQDERFVAFAEGWLSGADRSGAEARAEEARAAAWVEAARAAAWAAARAAARAEAAWAGAWVEAAWAEAWVEARAAARAAARVAAWAAARAAAWAAEARAAGCDKKINFQEIALKAMQVQ